MSKLINGEPYLVENMENLLDSECRGRRLPGAGKKEGEDKQRQNEEDEEAEEEE